MEVTIHIPFNTPPIIIRLLEKEYPDVWEDAGWEEFRCFFVGKSSEEDDEDDPDGPISETFLTHEEAVECCGFCEGLIEGCDTLAGENGAWAQGMLCRRDFSSFSVDDETKAEWKRLSELWWCAHARGVAVKNGKN